LCDFLSLSRAESIDKKEYKHEFAFVEETAAARWSPPLIDTGTADRDDAAAGFFSHQSLAERLAFQTTTLYHLL
jgi:hypothetical protein